MIMQGGTRLKRGYITAISGLYIHKIDLKLDVVLICIVSIIGLIVIFINLSDWVVVNFIYLFFFRILIDALYLP